MKEKLSFLKKKRYIFGIIAIFLIVGGYFIFKNKNTGQETITAKLGNFENLVSISGKVIAGEDVDLGFSQGGRISSIRAKVGDNINSGTVIASIENGDLQANLVQREAILLGEQAKLKSLELGKRPEQIAIAETSVISAQTSLDQARQALVNTISDSYTKSDDAVKNKVDQFFQNPLSSNPTIVIFTNDSDLIVKTNTDRIHIGAMLESWKKSISQINSNSDLDNFTKETQDNLVLLKSFLAEVSLITNNNNSNYNGNMIPASWKSDTSTARINIDSAISSFTSIVTNYKNAQAGLATAQSNLFLEKAGATKEDIDAQNAQIKGAEADVMNARATLNKTLILAPFDGVITKMDAKVGEIASPNTSLITMMGTGTFQIESYVPEVNIAKILLGDTAKVTLDAYGDNVIFLAKVISIDPAETIKDGVSTYKVKLQFENKDDRIKSGMTANVSIMIFSKPNVIVVPGGVVFEKNSKKFVQIKVNDKTEDREITTGEVSSLGQVEVVSGLLDGDVVILNPIVK